MHELSYFLLLLISLEISRDFKRFPERLHDSDNRKRNLLIN